MTQTRPAAVSGSFYPDNPLILSKMIDDFLRHAKTIIEDSPTLTEKLKHLYQPSALIVPHAGYIYSGQTAAAAYQLLKQFKKQINRVVLVGPAHRVWVKGAALPSSEAFETPFGTIELDKKAIIELLALSQVMINDDAHALEHSLEVQLPFLQRVLGQFLLIPIVLGDISVEQTAELLSGFLKDDGSLLVISTDLSHFHDYHMANDIDNKTCDFIESFDSHSINGEMACGYKGLNGLISLAKTEPMKIIKLAQCNSGDTAGDKNRVVGYASYAFF